MSKLARTGSHLIGRELNAKTTNVLVTVKAVFHLFGLSQSCLHVLFSTYVSVVQTSIVCSFVNIMTYYPQLVILFREVILTLSVPA